METVEDFPIREGGSVVEREQDAPQPEAEPIATPEPEKENSGEDGEASVFLNRNAILSLKFVPKIQKVPVPEWGGFVFVRELSGTQRDQFELSTVQGRQGSREVNLRNLRARLVAFTTCDENGNLVFKPSDVEDLGKHSAKALTRIFNVAQQLSNISEEDVEELTQSLGEDRKEDSGSS